MFTYTHKGFVLVAQAYSAEGKYRHSADIHSYTIKMKHNSIL